MKETLQRTLTIEEDNDTGDLYIAIPPDIIESLNWQENDVLLWTENPNGSFTIQKQ